MPNNILSPVEENFATKFYFGISVNEFTFQQLVSEFHSEGYDLGRSSSNGFSDYIQVKMINKAGKKTIEVTTDSISFFPIVKDENEIEEIRKKIFKHVAKKFEVYSITSKENLTSSITSLLKNDLRSCASLLYYSLHKFTNTLLYNYYNIELVKNDHEIIFDEIEHFTSFMFYKFTEKSNDDAQINLNDALELMNQLSHHSSKSNIDPFMLIKYTWKVDEKTNLFLLPNITYLSSYLFKIDYHAEDSLQAYKDILEELSKVTSNKEVNVKKAIAYSLIKSIEEVEDKEIWMMYVVALRLYWLRQTADYEFDFDVITSVKEMTKMVHTIQNLIEHKESDSDKKINDIHPTQGSKLNENEETENTAKITCPLYSVDFTFPKKLLNEDREKSVTLFMSVLHLDSEFDRENILAALNFTPHITNQKDCFIYEVSNRDLSVYLYINFNEEGRWVFWFQDNILEINTYSEKDLKNAFVDFFTSLSKSYNDYHGVTLDTNLVGTNPIHMNQFFSLMDVEGLNLVEFELTKRRYQYKNILMDILGKVFDTTEDGLLVFGSLNLDFNLQFGVQFSIAFDARISAVINNNTPLLYVNFMIVNDINNKKGVYSLANYINEAPSFFTYHNIILDSKDFQNLLSTGKSSEVVKEFVDIVNNICYSEVSEELDRLEDVNLILEKCIELEPNSPIPYATLGYWYLRTKGDLTNGKKYYEESIRIDKEYNQGEFLTQLEQKYYLELAKYYCENEVDNNQALYYITEGLDKDPRFQEEFKELIFKHDIQFIENELVAAAEMEVDGGKQEIEE